MSEGPSGAASAEGEAATRPRAVRPRLGAALAACSALFAAGFLSAFRIATDEAPRDAAVLAMLAASAACNGAFAVARWSRRRPSRDAGAFARAVVVLGGLTVLGNVGVAGALARLEPGLTSTVQQSQVFFVGLGGWLLLGERVGARFFVGASFAVAGFAVLALDGGGAAAGAAEAAPLVGVLFALLASVSFGAMLLYTRKVIDAIDPVGVNVARLLLAVAALGAWVIPRGELAALSPTALAATAVAAACGPFVSRLCLMYAVEHVSASRAKLLTLLTPLFAFGFEALVFGTFPSGRELAGAALILAGVLLPLLAGLRRRA